MCQAGDVNAILVNPSLPPYASNGTLVTPMTATSIPFDVIVQTFNVWDVSGTLVGSLALDPTFNTPNGLKPYSPPNDQWRILFQGAELAAGVNHFASLTPYAHRGDWGGWKVQAPVDLTSAAGIGVQYVGNGPLYSGGGYTLQVQRETFITIGSQSYVEVGILYEAAFCLYGTHLLPPPSTPAAPTNLAWSAGSCEGAQVSLAWDAITGATYNVYRDSEEVATGLVSPDYVDDDAALGMAYTYAVTAVVGGIESMQSSFLTVTPCVVGSGNCTTWRRPAQTCAAFRRPASAATLWRPGRKPCDC